ncbi:transcriptional regulator [Agromyces mangrovi Wang et al. 2018]|nr:transcriptional regulator [Agromyces mangrovi]
MVRGEPGIGKTTLVGELARLAQGVRVIRADGFEAEQSMPYAALQRLGNPLARHLDALPAGQATALRIAAGLADGPPPDRFLVGLGTLSLLAAAGEQQPVLCIVDDAHLLDPESLEVLAFVARRLQAEAVALVLAVRPEASVAPALAGVPALELEGLDRRSAVRLLTGAASEPIDPYLATRVAEETGGNPLALVDLAHGSPSELTARAVAEEPVPIGERLEAHYARRFATLPDDTRLWLGVAAAESTGDGAAIAAAAAQLGLATDAPEPAERLHLVSVRGDVAFRHPLVRAAVYDAMPSADRRRVHRALADVAERDGREASAAWHAAAAVSGTDEATAARLVRAADSAGGRGGTASRARLLARAADLTPRGADRDGRLLDAAEAAAAAGAVQLALELVASLDPERLDDVGRGRVLALRAVLSLFVGDAQGITGGTASMLEAAALFHAADPAREQRALVTAFELCLTTEWMMRDATLAEVGARVGAGVGVADGAFDVALTAIEAHILAPYRESAPKLRAAVTMLEAADDALLGDYTTFTVASTMALWDERACLDLLRRAARAAREAGALRALDTTLWVLGLIELAIGDVVACGRTIEQVRELRRAIGYDAEQVVNAGYLAWAGAPVEVVEQVAEGARAGGWGGVWSLAEHGLAVRAIAEGHYRDAFERLHPMVTERDFLQVTYRHLPDYVEAGARAGRADLVRPSLARLEHQAEVSGTPWIRGVASRSAAVMAGDDEAERLHLDAIAHLCQTLAVGDLGRAHLVYGEWLRRMKRRREAREQLREALAIFQRAGAVAFAERARVELAATGEHVPHREPGAADELTPRESTIAELAAAGRTNAEIGATLFISANTVDYHLRKVFRKLGVTSRRQLAERMPRG